jgi:DNA polymerase-3 subunit alpha
MEVLCFYHHEHELAHVDNSKYGFSDFAKLSSTPEVDRIFNKGDSTIYLYKLNKICGTCIAKNKAKATVSLLTTSGVVEVKFRKEYFSLFDRQLSRKNPDGTKTVIEKSWFNRGEKIIVTGIRQGDEFIAKKYSSTPGHMLYRIDKILDNNELILQEERAQNED